jgi:hypothetical protein
VRHPHHYNPHQPRVPKGHATGGQWTDGNDGQATILEEGDRADRRYRQDTILQSPPRAEDGDAQDTRVRLAFLRGGLRPPFRRNTPSDIARQKALELERQKALERARKEAAEAAREKAIRHGLALFSALSALDTPDRRAVIEFKAHQYGRDKENTLEFKKLGVLTREEFKKMCKYLDDVQGFVDEAADEANREPGLTPQTYGTAVHKGLEAKIKDSRLDGLWAERSAVKSTAALPADIRKHIKQHGEAPRGYPETVRTDGFEYLGQGTVCVYDAKTGEARFPPSRMRALVDAIFSTDDIVPPGPERMAEIAKKIAARGLPVLRIIMTVVRPTIPRVLKPAR